MDTLKPSQKPKFIIYLKEKLCSFTKRHASIFITLALLVIMAAYLLLFNTKYHTPSTSSASPSEQSTPASTTSAGPDLLGNIHDYLSHFTQKMAAHPSGTNNTSPQPSEQNASMPSVTTTPPVKQPSIANIKPVVGVSDKVASQIVFAALDVKDAMLAGKPYQKELQALKRVSYKFPALLTEIDALQPYSATGIPTLLLLQTNFNALANQLIQNDITDHANATIGQRLWAYLFMYVNIHPVDATAVGNDTKAIIARSAAFVKSGTIPAALSEMSKLQGKALEKASFWINDASAYTNCQLALTNLFEYLRELAYSQDPVPTVNSQSN